MTVQTGDDADAASAELTKNGWIPVNVNLTPAEGSKVTLLGYKSADTAINAVTDIKVLPAGADASKVSADYKKIGEAANGDTYYTTTSTKNNQAISAEFSGIGAMSARKPAYKAMMTFGNLPYDFQSGKEFNTESEDAGAQADGSHMFLTFKQVQLYLTSLKMAAEDTRELAIQKLQNAGYSFIDRNLTPGTKKFTYLGYKGSTNATNCITDIRILPADVDFDTVVNYQYYQYLDYTIYGDMIYYTTNTKLGQPIIADFGVLGSYDDFDNTGKIISSFSNLPFDFSTALEFTPPEKPSAAEIKALEEQEEADLESSVEDEEEELPKDSIFLTYVSTRAPLYVKEVSIVSYYGNETAAQKELQAQGLTIINQNLTPNIYRTYTYFGYSLTTNPNIALTDLRMSPNNSAVNTLFGSANYGLTRKNSPKLGITSQGDGLYATSLTTHGDAITGDFVIVHDPKEAPAGYEPIMTFAGLPFNFNKPNQAYGEGISARAALEPRYTDDVYNTWMSEFPPVYLYYRPSVAYLPTNADGTAATKYIAGITPMLLPEEDDAVGVIARPFAAHLGSDLINSGAGTRFRIDDNLLKGTEYDHGTFKLDKTPRSTIMINYTYNPKRAITDFVSYTGIPSAESLQPVYGTQQGGGYAAQDPYFALYGVENIGVMDIDVYWILGFSATHDYLVSVNTQTGSKTEWLYDDRTDFKPEDFELEGYWPENPCTVDYSVKWSASQMRCKGIFGAGPMTGKAPLTYDDILFTNNGSYTPDGWKPVVDIRVHNSPVPHNLSYLPTEKAGGGVYMFVHRDRDTSQKKYISNVVLAVADTKMQVDAMKEKGQELTDEMYVAINKTNVESCMMTLLNSCTDEIIPYNLCTTFAGRYGVTGEPGKLSYQSSADYANGSLNYESPYMEGFIKEYNKMIGDLVPTWRKYVSGLTDQELQRGYMGQWMDLYDDERNGYTAMALWGQGIPWQYTIRDYGDPQTEYSIDSDVYVAMLGVSRTDNVNEAIRGLLKYKPTNDFAPQTITIGGVTYTRCGKQPVIDRYETYYIYQSSNLSLGDPITSIDFDTVAYAPGSKTAKTVTATGDNAKPAVDPNSFTYLHGKCDDNKGYVGRVYLAESDSINKAAADLMNQGATYVLDINLSENTGKIVFMGYGKVSTKEDAAYDVIVKTGTQPKLTKNAKGLDCAIIDGVEYFPARTSTGKQICINTAENAYLYYRSGAPIKDETPLMRLGVGERDRVPDNTGLIQPWEYILSDAGTRYNVNQNRFVLAEDSKTDLTDNRVYLFALRNPANGVYTKPGAEITGGHADALMNYGEFRIQSN